MSQTIFIIIFGVVFIFGIVFIFRVFIFVVVFHFGVVFILARACGVPVGRRSGGRLAMTLVAINYIIFFLLVFFPPSSTFLIEGGLGSKNFFSESWYERPKI